MRFQKHINKNNALRKEAGLPPVRLWRRQQMDDTIALCLQQLTTLAV